MISKEVLEKPIPKVPGHELKVTRSSFRYVYYRCIKCKLPFRLLENETVCYLSWLLCKDVVIIEAIPIFENLPICEERMIEQLLQ